MFIEIIIAILCGVTAGTFTGLCPGIHINLVSVIVVGLSSSIAALSGIQPIYIAVMIVAMGITHTFLDALPSTFLGCPDESMIMAALPAHKFLLKGKGMEAIKLLTFGAFACLLLTCGFVLLTLNFVKAAYNFIQPLIGFILIIAVAFIILKQPSLDKKLKTFLLFALSGLLGIAVLNLPNLSQPLLPMLSGMFGISTLLLSLSEKIKIPKQNNEGEKVDKKVTIKALLAGTVYGCLTGMLPGLGSAQAATIASAFIGNIGDAGYLLLVGGINTVNFLFSTATFYTLEKARNGAIVAVMEIVKSITFEQLLLLLVAAVVAGSIAVLLTMSLARKFSEIVTKVDYGKLCTAVLGLVFIIVFIFSGMMGIFVLLISTAVGLIAPLLHVPRSSAMGCLLLPVIFYFVL